MADRIKIERLPLSTIHREDYPEKIQYVGEQEHIQENGVITALFKSVDYSPNDADREWIARELGDVPIENRRCKCRELGRLADCPDYIDSVVTADYFGETVPVESLNRLTNNHERGE